MKNKEYWRQSLTNILEKEDITDILVEKIIGISEMEYEYAEFESHTPIREEVNPLSSKVKELEREIRIYKNSLCEIHKADYIRIIEDKVEWERKI